MMAHLAGCHAIRAAAQYACGPLTMETTLRTHIISCATLGDEMKRLADGSATCSCLPFGLHNTPDKLRATLQAEIDATPDDVDTILLGYGMCGRGALGLRSERCRLVIPKVDDCIALSLGSRAEHLRQIARAPGTFYLTKGWIESGDDPYTEYLKAAERYGHERAYRLEKRIIANYTRLAFINTGNGDMGEARAYAQRVADFFDMQFEEIEGSDLLLRKLVEGEWDQPWAHANGDFVVVEAGQTVEYAAFSDDR